MGINSELSKYLEKCGDEMGDRCWALYQHPGSVYSEYFTEDQFRLLLTVVDQFVRQLIYDYDMRDLLAVSPDPPCTDRPQP